MKNSISSGTNLSFKFVVRLKLDRRPAYRICQSAGVNPTWVSKVLNGIEEVQQNDPRIVAVGHVLGIGPEECFSIRDRVERTLEEQYPRG